MRVGRAAGASPRRQKTILAATVVRLETIVRLTSRRSIARKLPAGCGGALHDVLSALRTDVRTAARSLAR